VAEPDPLEAELFAGAAAALRKRADRQARISADGTTRGDRGVVIRKGEAVLAARMAQVFSQLADEFEGEAA
jgi:hypothetical protein